MDRSPLRKRYPSNSHRSIQPRRIEMTVDRVVPFFAVKDMEKSLDFGDQKVAVEGEILHLTEEF